VFLEGILHLSVYGGRGVTKAVFPESGSGDAPCSVIGAEVERVDVNDELFNLWVDLRDEAYSAPEALVLHVLGTTPRKPPDSGMVGRIAGGEGGAWVGRHTDTSSNLPKDDLGRRGGYSPGY
jgi:hypothetical protein